MEEEDDDVVAVVVSVVPVVPVVPVVAVVAVDDDIGCGFDSVDNDDTNVTCSTVR